jgi:hypothetical protein
MVAFAERVWSRMFWLGLAATVGLWASLATIGAPAPAPERISFVSGQCADRVVRRVTPPPASSVNDQSKDELEDQFLRALQMANDPTATATDRYEALALARKLDVVLRKQQGNAIEAAMKRVIPEAAHGYARQHDREHLELVRLNAEMLGVSL